MSETTLTSYHRRMRRVRRFWIGLTIFGLPLVLVGLLGSQTDDAARNLADEYVDGVASFVSFFLLLVVCYAVAAVWLRRPERFSRKRIALAAVLVVLSAAWILLIPLAWFVTNQS